MININSAEYLAQTYKKTGKLNSLELCELLEFILHSDDDLSIHISDMAFSNEDIFKGFNLLNSPLEKYETYGFFHPDEIEIFVYYFKWSMNNDAIMIRKFANMISHFTP